MPKKSGAPYDKRNEADYLAITQKIADALKEIESDSNIPATEKELAKRAGCSRGTLRNRAYPLARLRSIKAKRKQDLLNTFTKDSSKSKTNIDIHIEDKRKLLEQLENSRSEVAVWVEKYKESESERNRLLRARNLLMKENELLKNKKKYSQSTIDENTHEGNVQEKTIILPFPKASSKRSRKAKKKK